MRACVSLFKIRFMMGLQYRTRAFAGIATQFFFGFIYIMLYTALYDNSLPSAQQSISLPELATYVWLMQALLNMINIWSSDRELLQLITSGDIAYELCRPQRLYSLWFARNISTRLSATALRCFPIFAIAFFLPREYRLSLPAGGMAFILFLVTLMLGFALLIAYILLGVLIAFYTISADGIIWALVISAEFLSGHWVPIALFPEGIQRFIYMLPFAYISDFPFRIYSGNIGIEAALSGLLIQVIWLAVFIAAGQLILRTAIKRIVVQGG